MKKISLKDVKNGLKRDEMRVVSGGTDGSGSGFKCCIGSNCSVCRTYTPGSGIPTCSGGATVTSC